MIEMPLTEVAAAVAGRVVPAEAGTILVSAPASVDSRTSEPGGLFVALPGEHVDGHDFAEAAARRGASAALGLRPTALPTVVVEDVTLALGRLAGYVVGSLPNLRVHALTGSQGKTGTKDYLAAILAAAAPTVATQGNLNNELGVPLTALRAGVGTRFLVVEMGARGVGHIRYLAESVPPQVAAVLNVGTAHLGEFGSRDSIALAKGELVEALDPSGVAVLNADDPLTAAMAHRTQARVLTFGERGDVAWRGLRLDETGCPRFELRVADEWFALRLGQLGAHQVANAAAAAAMASVEEIAPADIVAALEAARPASRWRMERRERADGLVVINDAYNANPASMTAAIHALAALGGSAKRRRIAVLGEMRELGPDAEAEHARLGELVADAGIDVLVTVGGLADAIAEGASRAGRDVPIVVRADGRDEATAWLGQNVSATDLVLVKASRGVALEHVVEALMTFPNPAGGTT